MRAILISLGLSLSLCSVAGCGSASDDLDFLNTEQTGENTGFQFTETSESNESENTEPEIPQVSNDIIVTDGPSSVPTASSLVIKRFLWNIYI